MYSTVMDRFIIDRFGSSPTFELVIRLTSPKYIAFFGLTVSILSKNVSIIVNKLTADKIWNAIWWLGKITTMLKILRRF